jgi:hypothetical protein
VDYGFVNCETVQERLALREVYKRVLVGEFHEGGCGDPMGLHDACMGGYSSMLGVDRLNSKFSRLMTNLGNP